MTAAVDGPELTKKRRGYFVPGVIALVALVVLGVILGAGDLAHPADRTVDGPDIAQQISQGMQALNGSGDTPDVTCPAREPVREGLRFECSVTGAGYRDQTVYVVETDNRGEVRWSLTPP